MGSTARPTPSAPYGLSEYVADIEAILDRRPSLPVTIQQVSAATSRLVKADDWLAPGFKQSVPENYARYLLHRDRLNRFVVLSLVWLPGQSTPIHDHACWGVAGVLHGAIEEVHYDRLDDGSRADHAELREAESHRCKAGEVTYVLPPYREVHRIGNPTSQPAISIHVYGRELDEVNVYDPVTGRISRMRIKYYSPERAGSCNFVL
jgi:predicted metal-dependent enzyme (double-stranded beta helix superfamily)